MSNNKLDTQEEDDFFKNRQLLSIDCYKRGLCYDRLCKVNTIGCTMRRYPGFCNSINKKTQDDIILTIEKKCYNQACTKADEKNIPRNWKNKLFRDIYNQITTKVQMNLLYDEKIPNSDYLMKQILYEGYNINNIAKAPSIELRPTNKNLYNEINTRKQQKTKKKVSTQHECKKCGGSRTTETEIQARSLDEGSTLIIKCEMENCNNIWRISS